MNVISQAYEIDSAARPNDCRRPATFTDVGANLREWPFSYRGVPLRECYIGYSCFVMRGWRFESCRRKRNAETWESYGLSCAKRLALYRV